MPGIARRVVFLKYVDAVIKGEVISSEDKDIDKL